LEALVDEDDDEEDEDDEDEDEDDEDEESDDEDEDEKPKSSHKKVWINLSIMHLIHHNSYMRINCANHCCVCCLYIHALPIDSYVVMSS
jgi:hypothetical protein